MDRLAVYLGPHTARTALRTFSGRALGSPDAEALAASDAPRVLEALRPMLRTLLGESQSEVVLAEIRDELR